MLKSHISMGLRQALLVSSQCRRVSKMALTTYSCCATRTISEIDDEAMGEDAYPADELRRWKERHEGRNAPLLATLPPVDDETLERLLIQTFEPRLIAYSLSATNSSRRVKISQPQ
jgi:hypothetical protein